MNLIEALDAAGVEWKQGATSDEVNICCPFCVDQGESLDTRFRLGVNMRSGLAHCYNCDWGSRNSDFTFRSLERALATGAFEVSEHKPKKRSPKKVKLPSDFEHATKHGHWGRHAYEYLKKRGITKDQIQRFNIGYSVADDEMHHRVIFPVYVGDELRGIVGRDFTGKQKLRYRNSVGEKAMYNVRLHPKRTKLLLVEGVIDVLKVMDTAKELGIDTYGLLGHALKDDQVQYVEPYEEIILWLDPDKAGVKGFLSIPQKLQGKKISAILPFSNPGGLDPSEFSPKEIRHKLKHRTLFTETQQLKLRAWGFDDD